MSALAIRAESLSKEYRIGGHDPSASLRDLLAAAPRRIFRRLSGGAEDSAGKLWALRDVSLEVRPGEAVGIIGANGAGKSTLLKILSRITEPTRGRADIWGRMASLLEVGTGFHPELSGRDNIYLNGTILGMRRRDVRQRFDAIVDFAGVERFLDTPVKHYSSGMYVRLAFAVAAHLEPDILIVDEVLAVGDAAFQQKCLGRMADVTREGRTVLFVSHHLGMVGRLCQRALLLENGTVKAVGAVANVIGSYVTGIEGPGAASATPTPEADRDREAAIRGAHTTSSRGTTCTAFPHDASVDLTFELTLHEASSGLLLSVTVYRRLSHQAVFTSQTPSPGNGSARTSGRYAARMRIPANALTPGEYACDIGVVTPYGHIVDVVYQACPFTVMDVGSPLAQYEGRDYGVVFLPCEWSVADESPGERLIP